MVEPEVYVAASPMEEEERRMSEGRGLCGGETNGTAAGGEGGLHGVLMRGSQEGTVRDMLA